MERERIAVGGRGRGTARQNSLSGRGRGTARSAGADGEDGLPSRFNPLAMLARLPDDTPEVSPRETSSISEDNDDQTFSASPANSATSSVPAVPNPARVSLRPAPPKSARELLERSRSGFAYDNNNAHGNASNVEKSNASAPLVAAKVVPEVVSSPPPEVPSKPVVGTTFNAVVAAAKPSPPPPTKKKKRKVPPAKKNNPREQVPIRAPPPPPGMGGLANGSNINMNSSVAGDGAATMSSKRATASKFVPADVPLVEDGKDCVIVGTSLKGGTVQKVLEWLVFFEKNDENVKDFVLCFDAFVPLWKITTVLRQMHDHYVAADHQLAVRRFAARLFEARCRDDPGMEGAAELLALMRETLAAAPTARHLSLIKIVRARRAAESSISPPPLSQFMEFSPKALGDALTRYQHEIFRCIGMEELISWPLPARLMAGYLASTDRELHNWAVMAVALSPQPQQAARRLLQVMERLQQLNNFNSLMCLSSGLQRVSALLGVKQREKLESFALLVSPLHNYRSFREHLASIKSGATVFPIFDAHVGQLEFIHQEQAAYLGPTYINFRKVKLLGALFAQIKSFQNMKFEPGDARAFAYVLGIGQISPPEGHKLPLRSAPPPQTLPRLSVVFEEPPAILLEEHQPQLQQQQQQQPLSPKQPSPQSTSPFVSPRIVPPAASAAAAASGSGVVADEAASAVHVVENPLYSASLAELKHSEQRLRINAAISRLVRLADSGPLPARVLAAMHQSHGARGPPVGVSALLEPPPAEEEQQQASADPLILTRGNSLSAGLSRVRDVLNPKSSKHSREPERERPLPPAPPLHFPDLSAPRSPNVESVSLRHSSEAATESLSTGGRPNASEMDVEAVGTWLSGMNLEEHRAEFRSNQINGVALLLLNETDLRNMGVDKVGHRKQLLRAIGDLRLAAGLAPLSPRVEEEVVQVGGTDGTLHRRIAKKQEESEEVYVKGVFKGTVRLMRLGTEQLDVELLQHKFREEFGGEDGVIMYKDAEGDAIAIEKPSDLEYAIQDSALRGGIVKLTYSEK